jgi:hypothetical protein
MPVFLIDLFLSIADFFDEIRFGKRYGFGSFLWGLASSICLLLAALFFYLEWKALGILAVLAMIICGICSCCRGVRDMRKKATESVEEKT